MLRKPLRMLTPQDIEEVLGLPESDQLEFKSTIPATKGSDPWIAGEDRIGEYGRNELLAEIVAFANAHGGTLLLGVEETPDKPHRAASIAPVRRCADLAERLRQMARDCIEPQIPVLEIEGVPVRGDAGVVVARTERSRAAPHRMRTTLQCYVRRADRTEKMGMREIQDLTLQVERGLGKIEELLSERHRRFHEEFFQQPIAENVCHVGFRVSFVPLSPIYVAEVHRNPAVEPPFISLKATIDGRSQDLFGGRSPGTWRRILGGTYGSDGHREKWPVVTILRDGFLEFAMSASGDRDGQNQFRLYPGWIMSMVGNAMLCAEKFRCAAGAPSTEYAMDAEIAVIGGISVTQYGRNPYGIGAFEPGTIQFPRYSLGPRDEFAKLLTLFERDFWDSIGVERRSSGLQIDFSAALQSLGLA